VSSVQEQLRLSQLGRSDIAAEDRLIREFHLRGWSDEDDAAGAIVKALAQRGGQASRRIVLAAVPSNFLARNKLKRTDVARALDRLFQS
jgi:hypothetical protein